MREIKFRAWDKKRKIMIGSAYPDANWDYNKDEWYADIAYMELTGIENISSNGNYVVMQYTGLHDKNGKEIYEGDIVAFPTFRYVVSWNDKYAGWEPWVVFVEGQDNIVECDPLEVIGNIYENPKLASP